MNKKSILILLLSILSCFSMIRTARAIPTVHGYLGKNLEVYISLGTYSLQMAVNNTITVEIHVLNYLELYVKNLQLELDLDYGYQNFNVTVVSNLNLTLTAGWMGGFIRDYYFTPSHDGDLAIRVSADYEYMEGNQKLEQAGMIEEYAMIYIPERSYSDIHEQNGNLQREIGNLNTSYQNLNATYQDQQRSILFLTTATAVFIGATIFALLLGEMRLRRLKKSNTPADEKIQPP